MINQFDNKRILITGSSGSWGVELISQLLKTEVKEIRGLARNESKQVELVRKYSDTRLKIIIGDIRDYGKVEASCRGIDIIFHLAAMKHIDIAEKFPYECIKTNINGTRNLVRAAIANNVAQVTDVSTDKACSPLNLYGMCKAIGEKLILNGATISDKTNFTVIRSGNVLGTAGSVVPYWINQIKQTNKIGITDKKMTRYFLTLREAIQLLFLAESSDYSGGLFVTKMPSCRIIDLAKVLIRHYGNSSTKIEEIGMRQGEKLDEVLVSKDESPTTYEYQDNYYLIYPQKKLELPKVTFKEFSSSTKLMTLEEIASLLERGGFLK